MSEIIAGKAHIQILIGFAALLLKNVVKYFVGYF